jgi:hypothetical protein
MELTCLRIELFEEGDLPGTTTAIGFSVPLQCWQSVAGGREGRSALNEFKNGSSGYRSVTRQTSMKGSIALHLQMA